MASPTTSVPTTAAETTTEEHLTTLQTTEPTTLQSTLQSTLQTTLQTTLQSTQHTTHSSGMPLQTEDITTLKYTITMKELDTTTVNQRMEDAILSTTPSPVTEDRADDLVLQNVQSSGSELLIC